MELKPYQKNVIDDLAGYLGYLSKHRQTDIAFKKYWEDKIGPYDPVNNLGMKPYKNNVPHCIHVCMKVPTAGGKTFMAVNALKTIFDSYNDSKPKAVVWLVPWSNLLEQTRKNLSDPRHPYRSKLDSLFNHRVAVYTKDQLLDGANFNPASVEGQLNIFILSFSSLRIQKAKKEDRKIFQDNGNLAPFTQLNKNDEHLLAGTDETALINVIRNLNPVMVVDESHNAESELSVEMLKNLNPSFILDLTATPKENSNIISFVNAVALKKENMVKLPVIVYNQNDKNEVISNALHLQKKLELLAIEEEKQKGKYIRPIVLFQAQPKTGEDKTTFEKLKGKLIESGIQEEQIKIKTANINELKDVDLLSKDCPVRYIITINALKEGWDCPFAYVLASLADKSSAVDVEQILGRILRQPYVMQHNSDLLNLSYVLTASSKFQQTLDNVVSALNQAGFSARDHRFKDLTVTTKVTAEEEKAKGLFEKQEDTPEISEEIDPTKIELPKTAEVDSQVGAIQELTKTALDRSREFNDRIAQSESDDESGIPTELEGKVMTYKMKEVFAQEAEKIQLPKFFVKEEINEVFSYNEKGIELNKEYLLEDFQLSKADINIDFSNINTELYSVDLEETAKETYVPAISKLESTRVKEKLLEYLATKPKDIQIKQISGRLKQIIGAMHPIPDQDIQKYIERILAELNADQLKHLINYELSYMDKIKEKINQLADEHAEKEFFKFLDTDKIFITESYKLPKSITPGNLSSPITKSLYDREGKINSFEENLILEISNMENILFWHRNLERGKGFSINGYKSNHYPDFIIVTKTGKIILIETKGAFLNKSESAAKNRLGKAWANKAGDKYKYFMVFDKDPIQDSYTLAAFKTIIAEL